jgi:hypothetical protein
MMIGPAQSSGGADLAGLAGTLEDALKSSPRKPGADTRNLSPASQRARGGLGLANVIVDADVRELPSGHSFNLVA